MRRGELRGRESPGMRQEREDSRSIYTAPPSSRRFTRRGSSVGSLSPRFIRKRYIAVPQAALSPRESRLAIPCAAPSYHSTRSPGIGAGSGRAQLSRKGHRRGRPEGVSTVLAPARERLGGGDDGQTTGRRHDTALQKRKAQEREVSRTRGHVRGGEEKGSRKRAGDEREGGMKGGGRVREEGARPRRKRDDGKNQREVKRKNEGAGKDKEKGEGLVERIWRGRRVDAGRSTEARKRE
ncbi:hypothetical protein Tco_0877132 [Tanacetum coccineum]|uniref:Uncharacterized protein n=1 Tax=Tanacetum coccineum TaxID=301880 RepID=A0ABQ5BU88_9ASTR